MFFLFLIVDVVFLVFVVVAATQGMLCSSNDESFNINFSKIASTRGGAWTMYGNVFLSNICYEMSIYNFNQFNCESKNDQFFDLVSNWLNEHLSNRQCLLFLKILKIY